ncbi:LysR family transcriptional regulator [Streptomyces sp. NPDC026673]|uniref:LysR family transcriptional regulator n=1 Tax=Streptomyces sp. NPDC026673 TaxID=3155724 RepID=UPI0033FF239F
MELRHLEYFLAVAEELNFTRAARRLHVVQSGVSAAVRALEQELGAPLFERTSKHVALTVAGEALLPEARATLTAAQAARDAVGQVAGGLRGTVRVGTMPSVAILDLPGLFGRFHADHPQVGIRLMAPLGGSAGLAQALVDGELDVAFVSLPGRPPAGLTVRSLATVPLVAILPADHPRGAASSVTLADLAGEPFIDSPTGFGNRLVVDRGFAAAGLERFVVIEVTDVTTTADYVRHGLGVALMPSFAVRADDPGVCVRPVAGAVLEWPLGVAYSSVRRPGAALTALLALIGRYVRVPPEGP